MLNEKQNDIGSKVVWWDVAECYHQLGASMA